MPQTPNCNLQSAAPLLLVVPYYNPEGYGRQAFSYGLTLPEKRLPDTITKFKTVLKTHYLNRLTSTGELVCVTLGRSVFYELLIILLLFFIIFFFILFLYYYF